ncbi:MAG: protoporphyrinogen oxidase HemJ [Pseudomonadota bacterium]
MYEFMSSHYLLIKALHIIAIIAWMAALLYLPRLFVYHADAPVGSDRAQMLTTMEYRLYRYIMTPAMIASWVLGGTMLWLNDTLLQLGWMHSKLTLVILMTGAHHIFNRMRKDLAAGVNRRPARTFRIWNEVPTLLMIGIVLLVVLKPI